MLQRLGKRVVAAARCAALISCGRCHRCGISGIPWEDTFACLGNQFAFLFGKTEHENTTLFFTLRQLRRRHFRIDLVIMSMTSFTRKIGGHEEIWHCSGVVLATGGGSGTKPVPGSCSNRSARVLHLKLNFCRGATSIYLSATEGDLTEAQNFVRTITAEQRVQQSDSRSRCHALSRQNSS